MKQISYYQFPQPSQKVVDLLYSIQSGQNSNNLKLLQQITEQQTPALEKALIDLGGIGKQFIEFGLKRMSEQALFLLTNPIQKCVLVDEQQIEFTRKEIYQILSLSFFSLLIKQEEYNFPYYYNLNAILNSQPEKCKCYIHYFLNSNELLWQEKVVLERIKFNQEYHCLNFFGSNSKELNPEIWQNSKTKLSQIQFSQQLIEENQNSLIVDFANKYIGGGVLNHGCVQEEILLTIMPEALIAVIFSSVLDNLEVVIIRNALRFSNYTGYRKQFQFQIRQPENLQQSILVLDALNFYISSKQFEKFKILREMNKALIGFCNQKETSKQLQSQQICTGKWGCGAFQGDIELKIIIQLIAFSIATSKNNSNMIFSTFKDNKEDYYKDNVDKIIKKYKTVGSLCKKLFSIQENNQDGVFNYLISK